MLVKAHGPETDGQYELAACPFCGKETSLCFANCQEMRACEDFRQCEDGHYLSVVCSFQRAGCGASSGYFPTAEEAAAAWNRRPVITIDGPEIGGPVVAVGHRTALRG
ncbi:MAG: hypothetical protein IKP40_13535 [Clostridia bacterium]|nr:hypothetical protein [Clostridia bacterium]